MGPQITQSIMLVCSTTEKSESQNVKTSQSFENWLISTENIVELLVTINLRCRSVLFILTTDKLHFHFQNENKQYWATPKVDGDRQFYNIPGWHPSSSGCEHWTAIWPLFSLHPILHSRSFARASFLHPCCQFLDTTLINLWYKKTPDVVKEEKLDSMDSYGTFHLLTLQLVAS